MIPWRFAKVAATSRSISLTSSRALPVNGARTSRARLIDPRRQAPYGGNPSSGCIYVKGAESGSVLAVHVGAIELDSFGFTEFLGSTGAMPAWLGGSA